jgi:phosphoribosylglycinamide formyltransferase-1
MPERNAPPNAANVTTTPRFVILISGQGSNLQAIVNHVRSRSINASFEHIVSNVPNAQGIDWARRQGLPTTVVDHRAFESRQAFDETLADLIQACSPDYVLLAGFMRILTPAFVKRFSGRLINIHPSLLPSFSGLHTHQRAIDSGVSCHGCTIHFVTEELDHGPIIAQAALPVLSNDTVESLTARVLSLEHELYPLVVEWLANNQVALSEKGLVTLRGVNNRHIWKSS